MILDTLVFDEGQVTCPTTGMNPQWGGCCQTLNGNVGRMTVIIADTTEEILNDNADGSGDRSND